MKTVFKKGMKVYDSVSFPDSEGKVVDVEERIDCVRVIVQFDCLDYEIPYTEKGIRASTRKESTPTLSTRPYTLQGFEQKAPTPTYEDAEEWIRKEYAKGNNHLMMKDVLEALRKLIILRDYYNEGWQPDWKDGSYKEILCFEADFHSKKDFKYRFYASKSEPRVLAFKNSEIRKKFFEDQKELLEIAKPLL